MYMLFDTHPLSSNNSSALGYSTANSARRFSVDNNYGGSLIFLAFWLAFCFGLIRGFRKRGAQECIHVFCLAVRPGSVRFKQKREGERERERKQGGKKEDVYKFRKDLHLLVSTPVRYGLTCTHVDASHGAKLRRHLTFTLMVRTFAIDRTTSPACNAMQPTPSAITDGVRL